MIFEIKNDLSLLGKHKNVKRFAWLPTRVGQSIIWLQSYFSQYQYDSVYTDGPYVNYRWKEVERYL